MGEELIVVINARQFGPLDYKNANKDTLINVSLFNSGTPMKRKYYHASKERHKPGDVLVGKSCGWSSNTPVVFMTQSPVPHYTIYSEAVANNWFIYRVVPTSEIKIGKCWDEALSESVEVIKCVGRAREFAKHSNKMGSRVFYYNVKHWTVR